jgi:hypothetical protein
MSSHAARSFFALSITAWFGLMLFAAAPAVAAEPSAGGAGYVNDGRLWGMACDGAFDNTAALQRAIDDVRRQGSPGNATGGGMLQLPPGFCIVSGPINVKGAITIAGAGAGAKPGPGNSGGTVVRTTSATADVFHVTSDNAVAFDNFEIDAGGKRKSAGAGIAISGGSPATANTYSKITRMRIVGMYDGISLGDAASWKIRDNAIVNSAHDGVAYRPSQRFHDGGGGGGASVLSGNTLWDLNQPGEANFVLQGGGDVELTNNKFLGAAYGILLSLAVGPTGTLLVTNNSFEEHTVANIALTQAVPGKNYANVAITGNQFSNFVQKPSDAQIYIGRGTPAPPQPKWIENIAITGNVFNDAVTNGISLITIDDGNGVTITGNLLNNRGAGTRATGITVRAAAANVIEFGNQGYSDDGKFELYSSINAASMAPLGSANPGRTATRKSNYALTAADNGVYFDNRGAVGEVDFLLLSKPSIGSRVCFIVAAPEVEKITAGAGARIAVGTRNSAVGGSIAADVPFAAACLHALSETQWVAVSATGEWRVD